MTIYLEGAYGHTMAERVIVYMPQDLANDLCDWAEISGENFSPVISQALRKYVAKHKDAIEEYRAFVAKYRKETTK